jgi:formylglycine-generating enzyme required for sulfatase activity
MGGSRSDGAQRRSNGERLGSLLDHDFDVPPTEQSHRGMVWIPGGPFRMGSGWHYPEEAVWRLPVINRTRSA